MNWEWLLFGFRGRIARMPYWIGTAMSMAVMVIALLFVITGAESVWALAVFVLLLLIAGFIGIALSLKRLHDRNKGAWWLVLYLAAPGIFDLAARASDADGLDLVFFVASLVISIWALIDLGFLRGTRGQNRFGEDPLERPAA